MEAPLTDADAVGSIPAGTPVRLEIDVERNAYRYVALTADELKQRDADTAAATAQAVAADAAVRTRAALVAKLAGGTASLAEMQKALADLMGD